MSELIKTKDEQIKALRNRIREMETIIAAACLSQPECKLIVNDVTLKRLRPGNFRVESFRNEAMRATVFKAGISDYLRQASQKQPNESA